MSLKVLLLPGQQVAQSALPDLSNAQPGDAVMLVHELRVVPLKDLVELARNPRLQSSLVGEVVEATQVDKSEA